MATYRAGDLILKGTPIAFALYSEERKSKCDNCFKTILSQFECSSCKYIRYCSLNCAKNGYEIHKDECKVLKERPLHNLTRLIYRLIRFNEKNPLSYDLVDGKKRQLSDLMDHVNEIKNDFEAMLWFNSVFSELELIDENLDINYVLQIYGKVAQIHLRFMMRNSAPIGRAVYLGASIFDHSCTPDASFTFIGTTIFIKATRDLNVNSLREIYISYINELDYKDDRISSLEAQYYFKCKCIRCRIQVTNETNRFSSENQLRSICDLIDKLGLDFGAIIFKYIQKLKTLGNRKSIKLIDLVEEEIEKNIPENVKIFNGLIELARKLEKSNLQVIGPLTAKIFDFLSYVDTDVKLSIQVIDYFRKYYGMVHFRLAQKLYLTALLIQEKDCRLRNQLLTEALKIAQTISPTLNQIKQETKSRQTNLNNSFLNEIEKQLFIAKNTIQFDRKVVEKRPRYRSSSRPRNIIMPFRLSALS